MSFHGGFLGVLLSAWLFSRRRHLDFWRLMDLLAVGTPVGLLLGRCANFINGELYGHPTTMPWGIVFPRGGPEPRHPSQLYEALFEGLILGALLLVLARLRGSALAPGRLAGWFAMGYGVFRIALEQFRALDSAFNEQVFEVLHMSLGQALTLPLLLMGWYLLRREHHEPQTEALPTERETKKPPPRDAKPPHGRYKAESE
jgi:phosphatidylglycerol:prolipoprotein diacylglycerol transferase